MTKRVFIIHGWDGNPNDCWLPWLKKELEKREFEVAVPEMPKPKAPQIETWVEKIKEIAGKCDEETYFIGHSIGCQTIMRYLEILPESSKTGSLVFVAGFFNLPFLETEKEKSIAKPWLETPVDCDKVKKIAKKIIAIFSDDDPDVPLSDKELFKKKLGAKIVVLHAKGHFSDDAGIKELPEILEYLR